MISEYDGALMSALADVIVRRLNDIGVQALFGVPGGGHNLDLIQAAGDASLPFVLTATETGGALAAMAQAEVTGRPGACLTTLGPGAASVANGVACAFLDRAPLMVFTDRYPVSAGMYEHQQFDHAALFKPITKWSGSLSPDGALRTLECAVEAVLGLPPGPVHLDCPGDGGAGTEKGTVASPSPSDVAGSRGDSRFEHLVAGARTPLIIVGLGARRAEDAAAIRSFLGRRGIPAMVTYKAKGVVSDDHVCYSGVFTHAVIERPIIEKSDLIVGIGLDPVELLPRPWDYHQPIVYVGRWRVPDSHVPFAMQYVAEIPDAVAALDAHMGKSEWDLDDVQAQVSQQRQSIDIPTEGLSAQLVVALAAERLAGEACVTVDAGAHMLPATILWPVAQPNQMLISNGLSTMGFALPAAIGAALLAPDRRTVALTGDGGLLMCAAELLTAARERLPIVVIVFNDASLSLIEIKQRRRRLWPAGVTLGSVKWADVAVGFDVAPFVVDSEAALARALDSAMHVEGPCLIEAKIDRSNYAQMLKVIRG
jgi:acetolactate synthase-1/2/3 large subunit